MKNSTNLFNYIFSTSLNVQLLQEKINRQLVLTGGKKQNQKCILIHDSIRAVQNEKDGTLANKIRHLARWKIYARDRCRINVAKIVLFQYFINHSHTYGIWIRYFGMLVAKVRFYGAALSSRDCRNTFTSLDFLHISPYEGTAITIFTHIPSIITFYWNGKNAKNTSVHPTRR